MKFIKTKSGRGGLAGFPKVKAYIDRGKSNFDEEMRK